MSIMECFSMDDHADHVSDDSDHAVDAHHYLVV